LVHLGEPRRPGTSIRRVPAVDIAVARTTRTAGDPAECGMQVRPADYSREDARGEPWLSRRHPIQEVKIIHNA
jgi:hypothetical protein